MVKRVLFLLSAFLLLGEANLIAQKRVESEFSSTRDYGDDEDLLYRREFVYGLNFNTNGGLLGGFTFKHARVISKFMFHSFSLEMVNVKHPKEQRNQNTSSGGSYIYGKTNYLYVIRPQYGREIVLFQKAKVQGIQVNWLTAVGPAIGVAAPYLIDYEYGSTLIRTEQYNPEIHTEASNILGTGGFMQSLSRAKIEPGLCFKSSFSFEFGTFKNNVTGFEAGLMLDAFANEIVIIPGAENRQVYSSAFLTFFYGLRK